MAKNALLLTLAVIGIVFIFVWAAGARAPARRPGQDSGTPSPLQAFVGFVTNFFDTLGIGSFATTTTIFKLRRWSTIGWFPAR